MIQREITLIQELRTRVIADVVTGKLDVRSTASILPASIDVGTIDDQEVVDDLEEAIEEIEEVTA